MSSFTDELATTSPVPVGLSQSVKDSPSSTIRIPSLTTTLPFSPTGDPEGRYTRPIAGTDTTLHIYLFEDEEMDSLAIQSLFDRARTTVLQRIADGGGSRYADHWLTPEDDPLVIEYQASTELGGNGCWFFAQSTTTEPGVQQHLTYKIMKNVIWGLRDFVVVENMYLGLTFEVEVRDWGTVGGGLVMPGELPAMGTTNSKFPGLLSNFRGFNMSAMVAALEQQ